MIPCEVIDLKKNYGKTNAVSKISFNVKEGEVVGLIGANGSGKTTTLHALAGLVVPTDGYAVLFQEDAIKKGAQTRKGLGFASAESSFFPSLTSRQNLQFIADSKGVSYDRIDYLATALELNLSKKAKELSLGNKKKLSIVGAMLSSPQLLILDEPTEGLDPLIKQSFIALIEEEKKRGASVLISSHSLADVQRLCDRVVIISQGKVVAIEQMQELKLKRLKNVVIETKYSIPEITLSGVSGLKQNENLISFRFNGEMKRLIEFLNSIDIDNVQISDADLESMFLHFYE